MDLEGDAAVWSKVLEGIGQQERPQYQIVAFGPHEDVATMERARNLGCDLALSKGEFNRDLPRLSRRWGTVKEWPGDANNASTEEEHCKSG